MSERRLTDWIDAYMTFTENTEPAELFRKWTAVSVVAMALRRKCRLDWGSLTFYPNMYIVLVGPSGSRKGTAMDPAFDIACEIADIKMAAEATTREALIRQLKKANYTESDLKTGKSNFHSSLTIWSQELTVFLGYHNRQLMADLCDWYDCRPRWKYETKTQGIDEIIGVWVHLHAATTPELIQTSVPLDAIGGGLTSRMVIVYEPRKGKLSPYPELTPEQLSLREHLIRDLGHINMMSGVFKYTKDFMDHWIEWYTYQDANPPFVDDKFDGYFGRRAAHVMKVSMALSASRQDCIQKEEMVVTRDDLINSITLLEQTEKKMPNAFSGVGKSPIADLMPRLMAAIANEGDKGIMLHELVFRFYRDADEIMLERAVRGLERMKFCSQKIATGGTLVKYLSDGERLRLFNGREEEDDREPITGTDESSTGSTD